MNTRLTIRRPDRAVAVVGAVVAVSAATMMALIAGSAGAAPTTGQPGRCVQSVNVRTEPDINSRIVAVCEAGRKVQVGATRNGFVQLSDFTGWAAQEYVSVNGATPPAPVARPTATSGGRVIPNQSADIRPGDRSRTSRAAVVPTPTPAPAAVPAAGPLDGTLGGLFRH